MMMLGRAWSDGNSHRYGYNGQELENEVYNSGQTYSAKFWQYDSRLGRRWNLDPISIDWGSSYFVLGNNPMALVDPIGLSPTDYIDIKTGEHLEHVEDGIDEAIAIDKTVYQSLKDEGNLGNDIAKSVGGYSLGSYTDFNVLASGIYGEMDWIGPPVFEEAAAFYNTLENRATSNNTSPLFELKKKDQVYGYDPDNPKSNYNYALNRVTNKYNVERLNTAFKAVMIGKLTETDYSNGANG